MAGLGAGTAGVQILIDFILILDNSSYRLLALA